MELFRKRKKENEPALNPEIESALSEEAMAEDTAGPEAETLDEGLAEESANSSAEEPAEERTEESDEEAVAEPEGEAAKAKEPEDAPEDAPKELTLAALLETLSPEGVEIFRKALAEAEVRGRNTAIEEHLLAIDDSDGVPHPGCGQGASLRSQPASIFDLARMARR